MKQVLEEICEDKDESLEDINILIVANNDRTCLLIKQVLNRISVSIGLINLYAFKHLKDSEMLGSQLNTGATVIKQNLSDDVYNELNEESEKEDFFEKLKLKNDLKKFGKKKKEQNTKKKFTNINTDYKEEE